MDLVTIFNFIYSMIRYIFGVTYIAVISVVIACCVAWLFHQLPDFIKVKLKVFPRDLNFLRKLLNVFIKTVFHYYKNDTISTVFSKHVTSCPNRPAILFEDQSWTFKDIDTYSNKVAQYFKSIGIKYSDNIAIYMLNRPEYICVLLGLAKIGAKASFINYNLKGQSLLHCINTVTGTKALLYEECLESSIVSAYGSLDKNIQGMTYCIRERTSSEITVGRDLVKELKKVPSTLPSLPSKLTSNDVACYIFTSGTTGLPKAVPISHMRYLTCGTAYSTVCSTDSNDILYICLPLYHISGSAMCMGQMIERGVTAALARKFSAKEFWKDCIKYKCTAFMYVGEICRYILSVPPSPSDKEHCVRVAFGNGLRRDIWTEFRNRFEIPQLIECYGSTEGNIALINHKGREGAIGFKTISLPMLSPFYLIKVNLSSGAVERNKDGFCSEVPCGERGMMVSRLTKDPMRKFAGYTNKDATNKKILCDVFKRGDMYFNTGDIMYMDKEGYYYFSDRVGDTYRWKGENVSTTEVENIISSLLPSTATRDVVLVFGVEIPKADGRAGMAVIPRSVTKDINMSKLGSALKPVLPSYALPLFIRIVDSVELTGTFKLLKTRYRKEGYDPSLTATGDEVYMYDKGQGMYVPFNEEHYSMIQDGTLRF